MRKQKLHNFCVPVRRGEKERCSPKLVDCINSNAVREPLRYAVQLPVSCAL